MMLWILLGCVASHHERLGNQARAAGETERAIAAYTAALGESPIMDFEFARIREKRLALLEGTWGPRADAVIDPTAPPSPAYIGALLTLRQEAASGLAPRAMVLRVDAEIARVSIAEPLAATTSDAVLPRARELVALFAQAHVAGAPAGVVDAIVAACVATLGIGAGDPGPAGGVSRLEALLDLRRAIRAAGMPAVVDRALDADLDRLGDAGFPRATAADARAQLAAALAMRARAVRLGAPPGALRLVDRIDADALGHVVAEVDADLAARRYVRAWDTLSPLAGQVPDGHPLRVRLAGIAAEGAAWHTGQADALPAGYRRWLQRALASALGAADVPAERAALLPGVTTSLALKGEAVANASCAAAVAGVLGALPRGARAQPATVTLSGCTSGETRASTTRTHAYTTEERYTVQEEQQTGVRLETVQVGSHQEQCSKPSSLDGYAWVGLCDVPDYETRQVPVYALVNVEKIRDVTGSVPYTITTWTRAAAVAGEVVTVWEDGTALRVPFTASRSDSGETYAYEVPGRRLGDPPQRFRRDLDPSFTLANTAASTAREAGASAGRLTEASVRRHRSALARQAGAAAAAVGDDAAAGEAFVRSVLLDGEVLGEAATWLTLATGLAPDVVGPILAGDRRQLPAPASLPGADPYAPGPPVAATAGYDAAAGALERETDVVTTALYHDGVLPPNEFVDMHVGLVPLDVDTPDTAAVAGSRVAPAVGFDLHYSLFEMLGVRYGLVVHDELGGRLALGMVATGKSTWANGEDEQPLALLFDGHYGFYPGLRFHYFGVFAGASAGYLHHTNGDLRVRGVHVEPVGRLALRLFHTKQLILEASGFWSPLDVARRDRLMVSFPVPGGTGLDLKLSAERTVLPAKTRRPSGEGWQEIDARPVQMVGVQVGARL